MFDHPPLHDGAMLAPPWSGDANLSQDGLMACPAVLMAGPWNQFQAQSIYRLAYEQARAALGAARRRRLQTPCLN